MKIYWMFLVLSLFMCLLGSYNYRTVSFYGIREKRATKGQCVLFFGIIVLFCGLRSGIADTGAYIRMFEDYPSNYRAVDWGAVSKDKGFYLLGVLYKQFLSEDYHGWLFIIAAISGIALTIAFYKYASNFGMSCYLFIASTMFVCFVNGMRQFLCVCVILAASCWIAERKYIRFILLILVLMPIHASVLIFIPLCFLVNAEPWSSKMLLVILGFVIFLIGFDRLFPFLSDIMEETQYAEYAELLVTGTGASSIRLLIALIPCALSLMGRRIFQSKKTPMVNVMINISVINALLYTVAVILNGMVIGRLTIFFDIYNVILLPWLIDHVFETRSSRMVKIACVVAYSIFFYYQMVITWNLPYESDILNIFC